jgi:hypothetical protein
MLLKWNFRHEADSRHSTPKPPLAPRRLYGEKATAHPKAVAHEPTIKLVRGVRIRIRHYIFKNPQPVPILSQMDPLLYSQRTHNTPP